MFYRHWQAVGYGRIVSWCGLVGINPSPWLISCSVVRMVAILFFVVGTRPFSVFGAFNRLSAVAAWRSNYSSTVSVGRSELPVVFLRHRDLPILCFVQT